MNHSNFAVFRPAILMRAGLPALCSLGMVWLLFDHLSEIDLADARLAVSAFETSTWIWGVIFTCLSFLAVSRYDPIASKILGIDTPPKRAISMGWKATAISQMVGFGLITGTIVRWLEMGLCPNRSDKNLMVQAFKVTALVSLCFLASWAIITVAFGVFFYLALPTIVAVVLASGLLIWWADKSVPRLRIRVIQFSAPASRLVVLTLIDTLFGAAAVYVFLPPEIASFQTVYMAFLLSYTIGLVSGLPGGMGPFELCMLMLLPSIEPAALAPALIGFRIVYFALPATCAVLLLGISALHRRPICVPHGFGSTIPNTLRSDAPPEADLASANGLSVFALDDKTAGALVLPTRTALIQLGDSFGKLASATHGFEALLEHAKWSKRHFAIYRCSRLTAYRAQAAGLKTLKFSTEAILDPTRFDLNVPARSSLRRKLRKAKKAGVSINTQPHDIECLSNIDQEWVQAHDQSRGFSTGRFTPQLLGRQRLYVAYVANRAVGFVTFSTTRSQWQLDLIRHGSSCPDGSIYALVVQALEDAHLSGISHVSLGSVPFAPPCQGIGLFGVLQAKIFDRSRALKGLYQFKKYFDPTWQDRYFAARSAWGGLICIGIILAEIFWQPARKNTAIKS